MLTPLLLHVIDLYNVPCSDMNTPKRKNVPYPTLRDPITLASHRYFPTTKANEAMEAMPCSFRGAFHVCATLMRILKLLLRSSVLVR